MINRNVNVDEYMEKTTLWKEEQNILRSIILESELIEEYKWKQPCYVFENSNVVMIGAFKNFAIISFLKGVFLKDEKKVLTQQGENTRSSRVIKFTNIEDIEKLKPTIKKYITEAIEIEKAGLKVDYKKNNEVVYIDELQNILDKDIELKKSFEALTLGRRRAYNFYFSSAKQSATRVDRIKKYIPKILEGKGMNDWK
jgi:uncharacterized protein YdeI (YjbR/CyaY-like superfamily)